MAHKQKKTKNKHSNHIAPRHGTTYQEEQKIRIQCLIDKGILEGMQRTIDMVECVLHDPNIMGRDTFGKERMERFIKAVAERDDYYTIAFLNEKESDVKQEELDSELRRIHGENLVTFRERHPDIIVQDYSKVKKAWQ